MSGPPPDRLHGWRQGQQDAPMTIHRQSHTAVDLLGLDHVALALEDPEAMAAYLCEYVGMQELARGDGTIVVGAAGERGARLELLQADGPREPGALARLVLRVSDLRRAAAALPEGTEVDDDDPEFVRFTAPEGLRIDFSWMIAGIIDYDLDDVVLHVADSEDVRVALSEVGCVPRGDALHIGDKGITLEELSRPDRSPAARSHRRARQFDRGGRDAGACARPRGARAERRRRLLDRHPGSRAPAAGLRRVAASAGCVAEARAG